MHRGAQWGAVLANGVEGGIAVGVLGGSAVGVLGGSAVGVLGGSAAWGPNFRRPPSGFSVDGRRGQIGAPSEERLCGAVQVGRVTTAPSGEGRRLVGQWGPLYRAGDVDGVVVAHHRHGPGTTDPHHPTARRGTFRQHWQADRIEALQVTVLGLTHGGPWVGDGRPGGGPGFFLRGAGTCVG